MTTNYQGVETAAQSPGVAPGPNVARTISKPADTDGGTWGNAYQEMMSSADYDTWLCARTPDIADVFHRDDFLGDTIENSNWVAPPAAFTVVDDGANGGFGALKVTSPASTTTTMSSQSLPIGTGDFKLVAKARVVTAGLLALNVGLISATAAENIYWGINNGGGSDWNCLVGNAVVAGPFSTLGVTYHTIVIHRLGGTLTFFLDGVQKYSAANTTNIVGAKLSVQGAQTGSTLGEHRVDLVKLWMRRT